MSEVKTEAGQPVVKKSRKRKKETYLTDANFEHVKSLFVSEEIVLPPHTVYRWRGRGPRRYFIYDQTGQIIWFNGTSILQQVTEETPDGVLKWYSKLGYDEAKTIRKARGDYGTLLHIQRTEFLKKKKWDAELPAVEKLVAKYIKDEELDADVDEWSERLWRDMLALAQFDHDYNFQPIMIEAVLVSFELGIATALDAVGFVDHEIKTEVHVGTISKGKNKGQPKFETQRETVRKIAVIDWKSPRKASGEHNGIQLRLQDLILRENALTFNGIPLVPDFLFNVSPKEWKSKPGYHLTDQTNKVTPHEARLVSQLGSIRIPQLPMDVTTPQGTIKLGESPESSLSVLTPDQVIQKRMEEQLQKEEAKKAKK